MYPALSAAEAAVFEVQTDTPGMDESWRVSPADAREGFRLAWSGIGWRRLAREASTPGGEASSTRARLSKAKDVAFVEGVANPICFVVVLSRYLREQIELAQFFLVGTEPREPPGLCNTWVVSSGRTQASGVRWLWTVVGAGVARGPEARK